jgi:hypothetical protein
LSKIKKGSSTVKPTVKKIYMFLQIPISRTGCDFLKILTDLDSAGKGLSEKKLHKDKCKYKDTSLRYKKY